MSKHTPGPWRLDYRDIGGPFLEGVVDSRGEKIRLLGVALSMGPHQGDPEPEANSRLIAVAPDLLLIAKRVAVYFEGSDNDLGNDAAAAIAKSRRRLPSSTQGGRVMADTCIRDWAGFCWLASWGWPKCFSGKDREQCIEEDPAGNLETARQRHARRQITLNEKAGET